MPLIQVSNISNTSIARAPTVTMQVTTLHGQADLDVLPDSGADICAAGPDFVKSLGEHMDNLAKSDVTPRAVNGSILHPLGKF